jgi:hypothetical protein
MSMTTRHMTCCVCGSYAGRWQQHWNRDNGFGVCVPCVEWLRQRGQAMPVNTEAEIENLYGREGVNWGAAP